MTAMSEETRNSFENSSQADWRNFVITRIKVLAGRTVGSLTPLEFAAVCRSPGLAKVRDNWNIMDDEIRAHYYAITARSRYEAAFQEVKDPSAAPKPLELTTGLALPAPHASEAQRTLGTKIPPPECRGPEPLPASPNQHDEKVSSAEQSEQMPEANESEEAIVEAERSRKASEMVLRWIESARVDLQKARTYHDFKVIRDSAHLAGDFAAIMEASTQARTEAEKMRLLAERSMSLILKDPLTQRHESGRLKWGKHIPFPGRSGVECQKGFSWSKLGVEKNAANRLRNMAKFSDQEFEQRLEQRSQNGELIRSNFLSDKPKQKRGPKAPSRENCLKILLRLLDELNRLSGRSYDQDFFCSQKLDKAAYRKKRPELSRFVQSIDAFVQTP